MKIGAYYYPDQWPREQWERDFDSLVGLGLQIVHMGEFAWGTIESRDGEFHFEWLDECLALARQRKLDVILCTPTAVLPAWMVHKSPELLITGQRFGGRRHGVHTSPLLREYTERVVTKLAERYGDHPSVIGWQIDNELAGPFDQHECTHAAFRDWLRQKYQSIDELNRAWGCAFWNTFYSDWEQIKFPASRDPEYRNPHECLDASRFWSWSFADYTKLQADILRPRIGERFLTTNFMPLHLDCDPADFCDALTLWSWDSYPVHGWDREPKNENFRIADPAGIGLTHDHMAAMNGRWALMEIQPGQVNWSGVPVRLFPGTVRLWLWTAYAHGAEFITTYRLRRPRFGIELWHDALIGPDGVTPTVGGREFEQVIREVKRVTGSRSAAPQAAKDAIGIVIDFESIWWCTTLPQTKRWDQRAWLTRWYAAASRLGLPIRVVVPSREIPADVKVLVAPSVQLVDETLLSRWDRFARSGRHLLLTCRTGLFDRNGQIFEAEWAHKIRGLIGARIEAYDSLPVDLNGHVNFGGETFSWGAWGDQLLPDEGTETLGRYAEFFYRGAAAVTRRSLDRGAVWYCGVDGELSMLEKLMRSIADRAEIVTTLLPPRTQLLHRDGATIFLNYNDQAVEAPAASDAEFLLGDRKVGPADVAIWRET